MEKYKKDNEFIFFILYQKNYIYKNRLKWIKYGLGNAKPIGKNYKT